MTHDTQIKAAQDELRRIQQALIVALAGEKSRRRGPLVRQLHDIRAMLDRDYRYASQAGQDAIIDRAFRGKTGGTFVDVGGYDGVTGSNSLFFEKWRGWTGVLIEPVAAQLAKAKAVRACSCLGYAIADTEGVADFIAVTTGFTQMSGLSDSYDPAMLDRVRADPRHAETIVQVPTKTLSGILKEVNIPNPDFVSLDIEGGELSVLKGFPFDEHKVGTWAIENNTGTGEIATLMRNHGYNLLEFCGPDEIYMRKAI